MLVACLALCAFLPQLQPRRADIVSRSAVLRLVTDDDDEPGGDLAAPISSGDMERLRARIAKIQENGGALATPSQKFFDLAMSKPPQVLMQDFFQKRSPSVVQAMSEAVASLLGALPPFEFDTQVTTTGDKLAALMLQLQMTGYMLRNAEYVITMRKLLGLKTRSGAEYREAFERLDLDGSGCAPRPQSKPHTPRIALNAIHAQARVRRQTSRWVRSRACLLKCTRMACRPSR